MAPNTPDDDLGVTQELEVDHICVEFEAALKAGSPPRIEDILKDRAEPHRSQLLRQLVLLEVEYSKAAGKPRDLAEYLARFPADHALIREVDEDRKPSIAQTELPRMDSGHHDSTPSGSSLHGRFDPGQRVAGRYRIVSLLGKGGMGEVYRADDLVLGQSVALKFLPEDFANDSKRLEYFFSEVRLARQVSHPNVCRVHDIGEVDAQHFISMEFIDGEDLKTLIQRIGRLPSDKGLEIAQQLCLGLGAAHDQGVIHRDLKPANVMIDGRGQVRITDFGLATISDDEKAGKSLVGTPAYMAPEQLLSGETNKRTDIYSLGLVLFELLTGSPAHQHRSTDDSSDSRVRPASELVADIDPATERLVQNCLAHEPADRPTSAHAVAASMPGGDPLAAILAAGHLPSPELIAASGAEGSLSLKVGTCVVLFILAYLVVHPLLAQFGGRRLGLHPGVPKPDKLEGDLREDILDSPLGYFSESSPPRHAVHGLHLQTHPDGSQRMEFWYRQRQNEYIVPRTVHLDMAAESSSISLYNPPVFDRDMTSVRTDMNGKLIELLSLQDIIPEQVAAETNDQMLIQMAGLQPSNFSLIPQDSIALPAMLHGATRVYRGTGDNDRTCMVISRMNEAVRYFYAGPLDDENRLTGQWFILPSERPLVNSDMYRKNVVVTFTLSVVLVFTIPVAIRNLRLARADRKGAFRFAVFVGACDLLFWLIGLNHTASVGRELELFLNFLVPWTGYVFRMWVFYLAIEPLLRQYWPDVMISWSRANNRRVYDALVGRDILFGCLIATLSGTAICGMEMVAMRCGMPAQVGPEFDPSSQLRVVTFLLAGVVRSLTYCIAFLAVILLFRSVFKKSRIANPAFIFWFALIPLVNGLPITAILIMLILFTGTTIAMTRFGLVGGAAHIFANGVFGTFAHTHEINTWYGKATPIALSSIALVALYGFWTSTILPHRKSLARPT